MLMGVKAVVMVTQRTHTAVVVVTLITLEVFQYLNVSRDDTQTVFTGVKEINYGTLIPCTCSRLGHVIIVCMCVNQGFRSGSTLVS